MSECADGPWATRFLCVLTAPGTAVDLVLALAAALLAAVVAIAVLRRQLGHDRDVLNEQFQREAAVTRASFQRPYLDQLGNALIDFGSAVHEFSSPAIGDLLINGSDLPGKNFIQTWMRLETFTNVPDSEAPSDVWRDLVHHWRWCREFATRYLQNDTNEATLTACGLAADSVYTAPAARAQALGAAYLRWDGIGVLDMSEVLEDWERVKPRSDKPAYQRLRSSAESEFVRVLGKFLRGDTPQEAAVRQRLAEASR